VEYPSTKQSKSYVITTVPSKELSAFFAPCCFLSFCMALISNRFNNGWSEVLIELFDHFTHRPIPHLLDPLLAFSTSFFLKLQLTSPYTFWRLSRWIKGSNWGASASVICQDFFLPFICSFKIKTLVASIVAVLKLIIVCLRENFFLRVNVRKKFKNVLLLCLSFHFEKEIVNTAHPVWKKLGSLVIIRTIYYKNCT
jgi:uncharacterized membrane protein